MAGTVILDTIKSSVATPPVFQNTSGVEIGQLCRAWVNFTGSTGAINASFNVSSVTRTATGDYTANFTTALVDANYSAVANGGSISGHNEFAPGAPAYQAPTTTAFRFTMAAMSGSTQPLADPTKVNLAVFR